jgi:hypothetical protein
VRLHRLQGWPACPRVQTYEACRGAVSVQGLRVPLRRLPTQRNVFQGVHVQGQAPPMTSNLSYRCNNCGQPSATRTPRGSAQCPARGCHGLLVKADEDADQDAGLAEPVQLSETESIALGAMQPRDFLRAARYRLVSQDAQPAEG